MIRTSICRLSLVALFALVVLPGCGGPEVVVDPKASESAPVNGKEQIKKTLESIASSGSGGSACGGVRDGLMALKNTSDAQLADQLLAELEELEQLQNSEEIKAKAAAMAAQL